MSQCNVTTLTQKVLRLEGLVTKVHSATGNHTMGLKSGFTCSTVFDA